MAVTANMDSPFRLEPYISADSNPTLVDGPSRADTGAMCRKADIWVGFEHDIPVTCRPYLVLFGLDSTHCHSCEIEAGNGYSCPLTQRSWVFSNGIELDAGREWTHGMCLLAQGLHARHICIRQVSEDVPGTRETVKMQGITLEILWT
jgi:hypothetical protein